jgi:hypothetical protein
MDVNTLIDTLKDSSLLLSTNATDCNKLTEQYPYFASAQFLQYGSDTLQGKGDVQLAALYKQDPLLFAMMYTEFQQLVEQKNKKEAIVEEPKNELNSKENIIISTEVETKEPEKDILELINEIPNSNPITSSISNERELKTNHTTEEVQISPIGTPNPPSTDDMDKSLMVMMSLTDWLNYFKTKQQREKEEERDKKALKTSWQKEKLAAAVEEDVDEIPEPIFKQAMDSITMESNMISESLAKILATQGKTDKAIDMYKKLSLRNPEKSSYFANLIENLNSKRD